MRLGVLQRRFAFSGQRASTEEAPAPARVRMMTIAAAAPSCGAPREAFSQTWVASVEKPKGL